MYTLQSNLQRIKFIALAQAFVVISSIVLVGIPHSAHAADVNLTITRNGEIVDFGGFPVGEVYYGWRRDVLFAPLTDIVTTNGRSVSVSIISDQVPLNSINPKLYAVHGATQELVVASTSQRVWNVFAPPGSSATIVADIPNGVIETPLLWRFIAWCSRLSDKAWLLLGFAIPLFTFLTQYFYRALKYRTRPPALDNRILLASPAALTVLFRGFVSRRASAATLVDLACRGHLQLIVREDTVLMYRKQGKDALRPHEDIMLDRWLGGKSSSRSAAIQAEIHQELVSNRSTAANLEVYNEVAQYQWFSPQPLITHWQMLIFVFLITTVTSVLFMNIFLFLPSAYPLLWFFAGVLATIALLYIWVPTITRKTSHGKIAFQSLLGARAVLSVSRPVSIQAFNNSAWEQWLPLAMVLGASDAWLHRWESTTFKQPEWFLTPEPIRDFDQFFMKLKPVLNLASESIREKILPAYL